MALNLKTQVISSITDAVTSINIAQSHTFDDLATLTLPLNFSMGTYNLPLTSDWVKVDKGDIGIIRDIYIVLTSTPQDENIGIIITDTDPNTGPAAPTFKMRQTFVATTDIAATYDVYVKNLGTSAATLTTILGGENV